VVKIGLGPRKDEIYTLAVSISLDKFDDVVVFELLHILDIGTL
jgi:hypothetical protein